MFPAGDALTIAQDTYVATINACTGDMSDEASGAACMDAFITLRAMGNAGFIANISAVPNTLPGMVSLTQPRYTVKPWHTPCYDAAH